MLIFRNRSRIGDHSLTGDPSGACMNWPIPPLGRPSFRAWPFASPGPSRYFLSDYLYDQASGRSTLLPCMYLSSAGVLVAALNTTTCN